MLQYSPHYPPMSLTQLALNAAQQHLILSIAVLTIAVLIMVKLIRVLILGIVGSAFYVLHQYPLHVVELDHPDCRATWLTNGVLLTSLESGKTTAEVHLSTVKSALAVHGGIVASICLRLSKRLAGTN